MIVKIVRRFRRRWGWPGRRHAPEEPLYYSRLRHRSDEDWQAALAQSPSEAARWIYAAAVGGEIAAMVRWGQMLLDGQGTDRDAEAALRWFRIAAEAGDPDAINMLGRCHERGWGTAADPAAAATWFGQAADRGHGWAQFNLAMLLLEGQGVAADPRAALSLFVRSARQGNAKAMAMIGLGLEAGWAGRRNLAASRRWLRRAAERGCFRGAFHTARFLIAEGRTAEAVPWLEASIAAAPPEVCANMAEPLLARPEPEIQALGRCARARAVLRSLVSAIISSAAASGILVAE